MNFKGWREVKLTDITTKITKGTTPTSVGNSFVKSGVNFIKAEAITFNGTIDKSKFVFIDKETHEKLKRSKLEKDDILFSMAGMVLGKTAVVTKDLLPANTNQALALIRINKTLAIPKFVDYFMRQKSFFNYVNSSVGQSAQPNINLQQIGDLRINLPPLDVQRRIAVILTCLDDKIELNNQTNLTLHSIAQELYKKICLLHSSDVSEWKNSTLDSIIERRTVRINNRQATVLSAVQSSELVKSEEYFKKQVYSKSIKNYIAVEYLDFAYNPSRINIGSIGLLKEQILGAVSPVYVVFRPKQKYHWFIEFFLKQEATKTWINTLASGSVRQSLPFDDFSSIPCLVPPSDRIEVFNEKYNSISQLINHKKGEINTLVNIRDTLIPKIMNGEIPIEDTEKQIAAAI